MENWYEGRTKDGRILTLRLLVPSDAARAIEITDMVAKEQIYIGMSKFQPAVEDYAEEIAEYDPETRLVLAALVDGVMVGIIDCNRPINPKRHHSMGLGMFIIEPYRGIGIGSAMLETVLAWGRGRGLEKAYLSVYHSNDRAIALYRKFGFVECGCFHRQWKAGEQYLDEVFMELFF